MYHKVIQIQVTIVSVIHTTILILQEVAKQYLCGINMCGAHEKSLHWHR